MMDFTVEEMNFLCIFKDDCREDSIRNVRKIIPFIGNYDMIKIGESLLSKLERIPEEAYNEISFDETFEE